MDTFDKAKYGSFYLQEAIMEVMYANYESTETRVHNPKAIGEAAGVFREKGPAGLNDAIVVGILNELAAMGKVVKRSDERGAGWTLTEAEYKRRKFARSGNVVRKWRTKVTRPLVGLAVKACIWFLFN